MNEPLSSNEQTKVALFFLSLLPTLGLGGGGFLIVAYGLYMLNKQADPSFIEVTRKLFTGYSKIVFVIILFVSVTTAHNEYVKVSDNIQESTAKLAVYTEKRKDLYDTESVTTQTTPQPSQGLLNTSEAGLLGTSESLQPTQGFLPTSNAGFLPISSDGFLPVVSSPSLLESKQQQVAATAEAKKQALDQHIGFLDDIIAYNTNDINKGYSDYVIEVLFPAFIIPIVPILYIWMFNTLFYTILSKHKEWVVANGIFSTTPVETKHTRTIPLISFGKTASIADELIKLNNLKEANLITLDEFNTLRSKLLR